MLRLWIPLLLLIPNAFGWLNYSLTGEATMTHYTMDRGFIAACGCTGGSTYYPTAGEMDELCSSVEEANEPRLSSPQRNCIWIAG
jgi:hypothetical protein